MGNTGSFLFPLLSCCLGLISQGAHPRREGGFDRRRGESPAEERDGQHVAVSATHLLYDLGHVTAAFGALVSPLWKEEGEAIVSLPSIVLGDTGLRSAKLEQ